MDISEENVRLLFNDSTKLSGYGQYNYSNSSYLLLGAILENIYGKSYDKLLREKIFTPAKMNETQTSNFAIENKVTGYDKNGTEQEFFDWNALIAPAGLIKSTSFDMLKLLQKLLTTNGKIAKAANITEGTYFKNTRREVGLGQEIARTKTDTFYYKTGDTFSCSSIIAYDRKANWGMIILINQHNSDLIRELFNTNYENVLEK